MSETKSMTDERLEEIRSYVELRDDAKPDRAVYSDRAELLREVDRLRSSLVTASQERDEARKQRDEIGAFHVDLERIGRDEDATRAELARVSKEKDMFFERLREYARDLARVCQERDRLSAELDSMRRDRDYHKHGAQQSRAERDRLREALKGLLGFGPPKGGDAAWEFGVAALAPSPTMDFGGVSFPVVIDPRMRPDQPPYFMNTAPSPTEGPRPCANEEDCDCAASCFKVPTEEPRSAIDVERLRTAASAVLGLCNLLRGKGLYSDEVERKFCALSDAAGLTVGKGNYRPAEPTPPPETTPAQERCGDPVSAFSDCTLPYGHKGLHVYQPPDLELVGQWERRGHTPHCARRIAWGDGECECALRRAAPPEKTQTTADAQEAWDRATKHYTQRLGTIAAVAPRPAGPEKTYTREAICLAFGFMTAEVPELHGIEVPRMFEPFLRALDGDFSGLSTPSETAPKETP